MCLLGVEYPKIYDIRVSVLERVLRIIGTSALHAIPLGYDEPPVGRTLNNEIGDNRCSGTVALRRNDNVKPTSAVDGLKNLNGLVLESETQAAASPTKDKLQK